MRKFPLLLSTLALSVAGCDGTSVEESTSFTSREAAIKESVATKFRLSAAPVPGEYIVVLKPEETLSTQSVAELARTYRGQTGRVFRHALKGFVAYMSEADARELAADPRVKYVEENGQVQALAEIAQAIDGQPYFPVLDEYGTVWANCPRPAYMEGWDYSALF